MERPAHLALASSRMEDSVDTSHYGAINTPPQSVRFFKKFREYIRTLGSYSKFALIWPNVSQTSKTSAFEEWPTSL
jgi:hypothetical protein